MFAFVCLLEYYTTVIRQAHSQAGQIVRMGISREECTMECVKKYPYCVAADYVTYGTKACYHHTYQTSRPLFWIGGVDRYHVYSGHFGT